MNGLQMKYFVLKPKGSGAYEQASRQALHAYARSIRDENVKLSNDLHLWASGEEGAAHPDRCTSEYSR